MSSPRRRSVRLLLLSALTPLVMLGMLTGGAKAEAPTAKPAWEITGFAVPTILEPGSTFDFKESGPLYLINAVDIGGGSTTEPFTIRDTLPPGVHVASFKGPEAYYGITEHLEIPLTCGVSGQVVTCEGANVPPLRSGEEIRLYVPVDVESSPPASGLDVAEVGGGGAESVSTDLQTKIEAAKAPFEFRDGLGGLFDQPTDDSGTAARQAGEHPYQVAIGLGFPTQIQNDESLAAGGGVRDFSTVLPAGMVVDPQATPVKCTEAELESEPAGCPPASQVGIVRPLFTVHQQVGQFVQPLYNMVAPKGAPAEFGFELVAGTYLHLRGALRGDHYQLAAEANDVLAKEPVVGGQVTLWGDPSAASHDGVRGECLLVQSKRPQPPNCELALEHRTHTAFLTMPSACSGQLLTTAEADSWIEPNSPVSREYLGTDVHGNPVGVEGCSALEFEPSLEVTPEVNTADSPTGLSVDIKVPQNEEYENESGEQQLATANLKDVSVALPAGMTVNPSAADGLQGCTEEQVGYSPSTAGFDEAEPQCPDGSKVGTLEVQTPLLDHTLPGAVYLAQPYENPFGSLLALYVVIDDPQTGIVIKLPGHVVADPTTGQLTASFDENPQIPFSELRLHFFGGPRASLASPEVCGSYESKGLFGPWSGTPPVSLQSSFPTNSAPGGGVCATSAAGEANAPSFEAGTISSQAGSYSPFVLHIRRADGTQRISRVDTTLPLGLTGKLAGIPYCSDAALSAASAKTGREEQASSSCPAASQVGTVTVGAGVGSNPYYVGGKAYLAGPYKGAPLSLAIITPAVAGPFDLGTVVVRAALDVDPFSTQISVESDPLPTILQGIPLDVRSISVEVTRPGFTLNPTDCEPTAVGGQVVSVTGASAHLSKPFQVGGCKNLAFKPKIAISLKGATKRTGLPALKATVTYPQAGGYANIASAQVSLPHSEFLEQGNIGLACTKPVLQAHACPAKSVYGKAKAWSPLLEKPLEGDVYLVGGFGYKLPAMVAELNGQIRVLLVGKVDTGSSKGIRNTFEAVPDAPVEKFTLELKGGKKYGLLVNSENLCKKKQVGQAFFKAQNGKTLTLKPTIANSCGKDEKHKGKKSSGPSKHMKGTKAKGDGGSKKSSGNEKK